jgi:hypothetical protein
LPIVSVASGLSSIVPTFSALKYRSGGDGPADTLWVLPELVAFDLPALVSAAGYPGTAVIPALSSIASLLALKLVALPKATALTTYSYRLSHERQLGFLAALGQAMTGAGLAAGDEFDPPTSTP